MTRSEHSSKTGTMLSMTSCSSSVENAVSTTNAESSAEYVASDSATSERSSASFPNSSWASERPS